ncbi:MAG: phosphodiester glycosidase family protein [Ectothiorhodospiraceae bacterium]|nr:phosphodiester glycosidase family protein [Ectothiorhodospiraceae bacterium]
MGIVPCFPKAGWWIPALLLLLLVLQPGAASQGLCRGVVFDAAEFTVCTVDLDRHDMRLVWQDDEGRPYASFRNLPDRLDGRRVLLAMNAGMYNAALAPIGLYVEDGRQRQHLSTTDGPGNFHLKPNGVFHISDGRAAVTETEEFRALGTEPEYATQSGPMLVVNGELHPRLLPDSPSLKRRNGIGVRDPGTVVLAITEQPVNFHTFARLFRDALDCDNALFLDGSMSSLYLPADNRMDSLRPMGPMLVVLERDD